MNTVRYHLSDHNTPYTVEPVALWLEDEERIGNAALIADAIEAYASLPSLELYHVATARLRAAWL